MIKVKVNFVRGYMFYSITCAALMHPLHLHVVISLDHGRCKASGKRKVMNVAIK